MLSRLKIVSLVLLGIAGAIHYSGLFSQQSEVDVSQFKQDGWFGKSLKVGAPIPKDSTEIRPFKVNFSDEELKDLKDRLTKARFVDHVEDTQFTYGFNSLYLKEVIQYWRTKYDWRAEEAKLNAFPQFKTQIEGLDIHFIRVKPTKPAKTILPILVIHGWPGSVIEYYKSFPLLTEPDENGLAFEVIAPSIPGYGYSEAPHRKGFNVPAAGRVFVKLMRRLGFEKFLVHGGDWGNAITRTIGAAYPEHAIGVHLLGNFDSMGLTNSFSQIVKATFAAYFPSLYFGADVAEKEYAKMFPLKEKIVYSLEESGYMHIQATKPDTIGAALNDSPVGLAAYILEKFSTWTNAANRAQENGRLTERFTLDELLTNVMIYWSSGNIASSQRFYKENIAVLDKLMSLRVKSPSATVDTPHEISRTPRQFVEPNHVNLVQYTELPRGGHFTAFEEPRLVCDDIRAFVRKLIRLSLINVN